MACNLIFKALCFSLFFKFSPSFPSSLFFPTFSLLPSIFFSLLFVHACITPSSPVLSLSLTRHLSFLSLSFLSHSPPNRQFSSSSTVGHPVLSGRATAPLTWWSTSSPGRGGPVLSLALADRAETHTDSVEPDWMLKCLEGECVAYIPTLKQDHGLQT